MLARIRKAMQEKDQGFTLIELLVVIVIIGILAAIAIPTFLNQREKAWARSAQSDLRNAATQMESYFGDNGAYPTSASTDKPTFKTSDGNTITINSGGSTYCLNLVSTKLKGTEGNDDSSKWRFDSAAGKPANKACGTA